MGMTFCIDVPKFIEIGVTTSCRFLKMAAGSHIGFRVDNIWRPTECNCGSLYKFGVDRIPILKLWRFALKLPIHAVISAAHAENQRWIYFRGGNHAHRLTDLLALICHSTSNFKRRSFSDRVFTREVLHFKALLKRFLVQNFAGSRNVNSGPSMTQYLESPAHICLFTIQLSWGYDDD